MRPHINDVFMKTAILFAAMSTCARIKVGGVLVKEGRIISTGYNGSAPGECHCEDYFENSSILSLDDHIEFSRKYELHAEQNIISRCARVGISTEGGILFLTLSPCSQCAKLILASGIKEVYYLEQYDRETDGIKLLQDNGVICEQYKSKGN